MKRTLLVSILLLLTVFLPGQTLPQTQSDSYTRYELLAPETQSFRIIYDVSATTPGNIYYYNTLRKGSTHTVDAVYDLMTGKALQWKIVTGDIAKQNGHPKANPTTEYLQVKLARPVPEGGEARIRIDKTYQDTNSYFSTGRRITFSRSLGIKRNAIVLPVGYELLSCNYPSQVEIESDSRIKVSFMNTGIRAVPYRIEAQPLPKGHPKIISKNDPHPWKHYQRKPSGRDKSKARLNYQLKERAFQNREIVYYLQQPETHSFRLYHDYTESREGMDRYLNIVRAGSKASKPSAKILDTGEKLKVETLRGTQITGKGIQLNNPITPETEVVAIWFDPVKKGQSIRLRIEEIYTDPNRYLLYNEELIWDRSFGRNRNTVILPKGWYLTVNAIPAIISQTEEGQVQLHYINPRPDNIDVFIKARRK